MRTPFLSFSLLLVAGCSAPNPATSTPSTATPPAAPSPAAPSTGAAQPMNFYSLATRSLEGQPVDLSAYAGKVTLVVNVASACGYTPQYAGLQQLHASLQDRGFAVLGFPSNDFGAQEPGTPAEIRTFCTSKYAVDFPLFEKVQTKAGDGQSPIYRWLGDSGHLPGWNFCKYLIGADGKVRGFYPSKVKPDDAALRAAIDAALADARR